MVMPDMMTMKTKVVIMVMVVVVVMVILLLSISTSATQQPTFSRHSSASPVKRGNANFENDDDEKQSSQFR